MPHHARIGQRIESDIRAIARKGLLYGQDRMAGAVEMDQSAAVQRLGEPFGDAVEGCGVGLARALNQFDQAADVKIGHGCERSCEKGLARRVERIS